MKLPIPIEMFDNMQIYTYIFKLLICSHSYCFLTKNEAIKENRHPSSRLNRYDSIKLPYPYLSYSRNRKIKLAEESRG